MSHSRLLHLANYNSTNIGNGALIFGTEKVLSEDLGSEVTFIPEPWDDYTAVNLKRFDTKFVDLVNSKSDGLVIGAAVTLTGAAKFTKTGMRFDLPIDLLSRISKPIVFYAISYRSWPCDTYHNLDQLKRTMEYILASERILFSVRNDGTKEWLEHQLGYASENIVSIPDPALYVPVADSWHPELVQGKTNILISLSNEDETQRFGRGEMQTFSKRVLSHIPSRALRHMPGLQKKKAGWKGRKIEFLKGLVQALEKLSRESDLNLILCPHSHEDYMVIGEFMSHCSARFRNQVVISCGQSRVPRTSYFYDLYAKADVTLSMRTHSMVPAVGLGTPPVALVSHPKMLEFMTNVGLPDLAVDIYDFDLTEKVHGLIAYYLKDRDDIGERLQGVRSKMRQRTSAYNRRVASFLQA